MLESGLTIGLKHLRFGFAMFVTSLNPKLALLTMLNFQRKIGVWGETPLMTKNVSFWSKTVKKEHDYSPL